MIKPILKGDLRAQPTRLWSAGKDSVYKLHISLTESDPLIWRRFDVKGDYSLWRLHQVLQRVMGWEDSHLHEFIIEGKHYGRPDWDDDPGFGPQLFDERRFKVRSVAPNAGMAFQYIYDFGDGWMHEIRVEAIAPPNSSAYYPRCIGGANACPPEDSGGLGGYYDKLRIMNDPADPEHEDIKEWMSEFPPKPFSRDFINLSLRRFFKS